MSHRWYYQMLMEEFGPVTIDQIEQLRADGTLSDEDLIRREDQDTWSPLSEIQSLSGVRTSGSEFSEEPAEIGDLSELSFTFEENAPARKKPVPAEVKTTTRPESRIEAPPVVVEVQYYYQSLGQVLGPMPLRELIQLGEAGAVSSSDQVRKGETGVWRAAVDYPELAAAIFSAERAEDTGPSLSSATQKRLGAAALANLQAAQNEELLLEDVPVQEQPRNIRKDSPPETPQTTKPSRDSNPGTGKKRRRKTNDAVLEEIFDEVFTEDDSTSSRGAAVAASAAAAAAPVMPAMNPAAAAPAPMYAAPPAMPGMPGAAGMPGVPGMGSGGYPGMSPGFGAPARPAAPALKNTKKSSSGGGSLSLDMDGKSLGIVAGVLIAVGLVGAYFMGWVSLPAAISSVSIGEVESALSEVKTNFEKLDIKTVSEADWSAFQTSTRSKLAGLVTQLDKGSDPSPEIIKAHRIARKYMTMSYLKVTDKERIKKLKDEIAAQK